MTFNQAKNCYIKLLNDIPELDREIYSKVLGVDHIVANKKIKSPFIPDKTPSFQFRYCRMDDYFASTDSNTITRPVLCSVDYRSWPFSTKTYAIPISIIAWHYNLYTQFKKIDFPKIIQLIYQKLDIELDEDVDELEEFTIVNEINIEIDIPEQTSKNIIILDCDKISPVNFTKKDLLYWYTQCNADISILNTFNVQKALKAYVFDEESDKLNTLYDSSGSKNIADIDPCYIYTSQNNKIKLYRPKTKDRKYKWRSTHQNDDICGLNVVNLSSNSYIKKLVIQKALKECMLFYSLYPDIAVDSLPINSESSFFTDEFWETLVSHYGIENIYYIADNDVPGIKAAIKISKQYGIKVNWITDKTYKNTTDYWAECLAEKERIVSRTKMKYIINNLIDNSICYKKKAKNQSTKTSSSALHIINHLKSTIENDEIIFKTSIVKAC